MRQFHSGIITYKNKRAITNIDEDSHTELLEQAGLKDDTVNPNFVRVEILPQDGNIYNHKMSNWELQVDQDLIPDWFDKKKAETLMKKSLKNVFKHRFVMPGDTVDEITEGRWFINGGTVDYIRGGTVRNIRGGTVDYICGGTVHDICGGTVRNIYGGTVRNIWGGTVRNIRGGTVRNIWGGTVRNIYGGTVDYICGGTVTTYKEEIGMKLPVTADGIVIIREDKTIIRVADKSARLDIVK